MWRYGILTDTDEYIRVDDETGMPYKFVNGSWVKDTSLAGIYSDDIPTRPLTQEEVWNKLKLQK